MTKTFDPKCLELANWFLDDFENNKNCKKIKESERNSLASTIQQAIENWMEEQHNAEEARNDPSNREDQ